jgi:glutamate---cysteine ligase / carboxylate-amine ligase
MSLHRLPDARQLLPTEHRFGSSAAFSIGVEEELFLVDPVTGSPINASAAVLRRLGGTRGTVAQEYHACQLELITDICACAIEAVRELGRMRQAVLNTGAGLLAAGTHPSAREGDAVVSHKARYEWINYLLGDAAVTPIGALHVHVGMPDPVTAIRAFNGLRRDLPLLVALAANSPFRHGRDTGLASAREVSLREWPRSGVPRAMRDYADFCELSDLLTRAADVPDYTFFWWRLRPHPRLGTVEIRALDTQTSLSDTAALVALVHCLAYDAAEADSGVDPPPELIEEGIFRAARFGVHGQLPGPHGRLRSVSEILEDTLARVEKHAHALRCVDELARLPDLVRRGGGAGVQRAIDKKTGIDGLLRQLVRMTATPPPISHPGRDLSKKSARY